MTTQAMATKQNSQTALAMPMRQVTLEGMEDFSDADLEIPVVKIVHGVSRMEGADEHIGQFWNSMTEAFAKTLDVVILSARHSRALFSGDASEADRPECTSRDGVTGSEYGACSACEFNADLHRDLWDKDKGIKRCNKGYTLFLYDPASDEFAVFNATKTNVAPIKKLNTQLALKKKVPLFGAIITLATEKQEDGGKKWYQLAPKIKDVLPAEQVAEFRQMSAALRGVNIKVTDSEGVEGEAPAAADESWMEG